MIMMADYIMAIFLRSLTNFLISRIIIARFFNQLHFIGFQEITDSYRQGFNQFPKSILLPRSQRIEPICRNPMDARVLLLHLVDGHRPNLIRAVLADDLYYYFSIK